LPHSLWSEVRFNADGLSQVTTGSQNEVLDVVQWFRWGGLEVCTTELFQREGQGGFKVPQAIAANAVRHVDPGQRDRGRPQVGDVELVGETSLAGDADGGRWRRNLDIYRGDGWLPGFGARALARHNQPSDDDRDLKPGSPPPSRPHHRRSIPGGVAARDAEPRTRRTGPRWARSRTTVPALATGVPVQRRRLIHPIAQRPADLQRGSLQSREM
jgi:hypothetical protein